jgi:N-formylmaleamate deformylase
MTNWATGICETNRISMYYTRTGGNKPPLILLHGLMSSGICWTSIAQALEEGYDVIMPDARGHGKSSVPDDGYQYEDHANDVTGLIQALGLSPPIVLGHSMGGMTAALLAARQQTPLRGLILADPTFLNLEVQHEVYESDVAEQHRRFLNKSLDETLTEAQYKHPHRSLDTLKLMNIARHETSLNAFQVLIPPNPEYKQLVSTVDVPTLLVVGDTGIVSRSVAEELRSLNSRFHIEEISKVGHGLHYDRPEPFLMIIESFLKGRKGRCQSRLKDLKINNNQRNGC